MSPERFRKTGKNKPFPRLTIDNDVDAAYLYLQNRPVATTREIAPGVVVDFDDKGEVRGVELLGIKEGWGDRVIELTEEDKELLQKYAGLVSGRHREPYVRTVDDDGEIEREIWYLVNHTLGQSHEEAVKALIESFPDFTAEPARAAWLFCNSFPQISRALHFRHTGDFEHLEDEVGAMFPNEETLLKTLHLKP